MTHRRCLGLRGRGQESSDVLGPGPCWLVSGPSVGFTASDGGFLGKEGEFVTEGDDDDDDEDDDDDDWLITGKSSTGNLLIIW